MTVLDEGELLYSLPCFILVVVGDQFFRSEYQTFVSFTQNGEIQQLCECLAASALDQNAKSRFSYRSRREDILTRTWTIFGDVCLSSSMFNFAIQRSPAHALSSLLNRPGHFEGLLETVRFHKMQQASGIKIFA
jgi:hypothetical protein